MSRKFWDSVTVVGCGLIGASFALALKRAGACGRIAGWDTDPSALEAATAVGALDEVDESFVDDTVSRADLVYLAAPVGQIVEHLRAGARRFKPGAVVTDAGSTKVEVCRAARAEHLRGWRFVGGHPVAGSHLGGAAHAREDLFEGAPYVLAEPEDAGDAGAANALAETLGLLGARVRVMSPGEHDRAMALVSHLPQLVSCALASAIERRADSDELAGLSGAGYRDTTRLAASPWGVWRDIFATNAEAVADALDSFIAALAAARDELREHSRGARDESGGLAATRSLFARGRPAAGPSQGKFEKP